MKTLGQEEFLQLLVTQLTTQDPLNPQKDTDFIAQVAQFTALEQSRSMQTDIAQMRGQQQLLQANALLGKTVDLQLGEDMQARGVVSAVQIEDGTPQLIVNGEAFDLDQVLTITPALTDNQKISKNYAQLTPYRR
jgi:flagellar basal-body rod modification protein FlgD